MSRRINAGIIIRPKMLASIDSNKIRLRPLRISDSPFIRSGLNDEVILKMNGLNHPIHISWFSLWWWMKKTYHFLFCIEVDGKRIGFIGLYNLTPGEYAEISLVIFDKMFRKQGYGTKAFQLLLQWLQRYRLVKEIHVKVLTKNYDALSFWRKVGFLEMNTADNINECFSVLSIE